MYFKTIIFEIKAFNKYNQIVLNLLLNFLFLSIIAIVDHINAHFLKLFPNTLN
jgi:hypothetical protein